MQWSPQQDAALIAFDTWLKESREDVFLLFGYAGTGKTTLAKYFAESVNGPVFFAAYTGKAACMMRRKGCVGATTLHSLIYLPKDKSRLRMEALERRLREALPGSSEAEKLLREIQREHDNLCNPEYIRKEESELYGAALVVVDEVSMVDEKIGTDLLSFGVPVLVLGDPAQLPPISGGGYFTNRTPHVMLTEVHRQALDNPIIQLATQAREGAPIALGDYGKSRVITRRDIAESALVNFDQVLVGMNKTRREQNATMRGLLGREGVYPVDGDKLVCLRNNHGLGLLNGSLWSVKGTSVEHGEHSVLMTVSNLDGEDIPDMKLAAWKHPFEGVEKKMEWKKRIWFNEFDYGYALTVHKFQGSQADNVLLIDESGVFREHRDRWLYTGITRAAERIIIVR